MSPIQWKWTFALLALACRIPVAAGADTAPKREVESGDKSTGQEVARLSVGETGTLRQIVVPGPKRQARPAGDDTPFVVRIDAVYPHGTDWRYDLSFYGLEPGRYNVLDYLQPEMESDRNGTETPAAPIWVDVYSVLPAGKVAPHDLTLRPTPRISHYRWWLATAGALWLIGLIVLFWIGRRRKQLEAESETQQVTWADRLRPLVEQARDGALSQREQAELERLLITYWQRKLGLESAPPAKMMAQLREHAEAGPLLKQLEAWLHHPQPEAPADLEALLRPYCDVVEEKEAV